MIRKPGLLVTALAVLAAVSAAGCGSDSPDAKLAGTELHIYNWDDYIAPETIPAFEKEFGVTVDLETFESEQELVATVASDPSRFDLFIAGHAMVGEMRELKLLAELDRGNIPNLANIDSRFLDWKYDPGNMFSVPYDWGDHGHPL